MQLRSRKMALSVVGLLVLVTAAYSNHFGNSFHFDDSHTILENPYIRDLRDIGLIFTDARTFSALPSNRVYRPIVTASLAVDYAIGRGLNPFYFQISTFIWFALQLIMMLALYRKILSRAGLAQDTAWAALLAAAVYGVHPAIAETVNYAIQRGDVYSTLGVVASLLIFAFLPALRKTGLYLVPFVLAILSKAQALIFPPILFAYLELFEEGDWRQHLKQCAPAIAVSAAFGWIVSTMTPATFVPTSGSAYAYRITQPLVALRYFRSFFLPNRLTADTDFTAVNGIFDRGAWLGWVFIVLCVAAAIWCSRHREWRPAAFGLWWFILALVPTAVFPLAEVENDHRMYFPFVGLALAAVWTPAIGVYRFGKLQRPAAMGIAAVCIAVLSASVFATRRRNEVWKTDETLWFDVTQKSPGNGRGLMNYGLTQMEKGDYQRALDYFERAAILDPSYAFLEINRGIANGGLKHDAAAEMHFLRALALAPESAESHFFYARWLRQQSRFQDAIAELNKAMVANPDYLSAYYLAMDIYAVQGDGVRLGATAQNALRRFPSDATAAAYARQAGSFGHLPPPRTADDFVNLSLADYRSGNYKESIDAAREALKLQPDYAAAYNNISAAYAQMHEWDQAIEAARRAIELMPGFQLAQNNLAWAESQKRILQQEHAIPVKPPASVGR
jgi:tetratricopeptide (TPR) repeat protein